MRISEAANDEGLREFVETLLQRFPEIEEVYLVGSARGLVGQRPDISLLLYVPYEEAVELMRGLARAELELRTTDMVVHLYVEYYGVTLSGLWGGSLIPYSEVKQW